MDCDKCGKSVNPRDDAVRISAIAWNEPLTLLFAGARHIRCSPSRAQHIVHPHFKPVFDDRYAFDKRQWTDPSHPVYKKHGSDYVKECERRYTDAWIQLQDECDLEEAKNRAFKRSRKYIELQKKIKKARKEKRRLERQKKNENN